MKTKKPRIRLTMLREHAVLRGQRERKEREEILSKYPSLTDESLQRKPWTPIQNLRRKAAVLEKKINQPIVDSRALIGHTL